MFMGEMVGETFVTITPIVDEPKFRAQAESQIKAATEAIKVTVPVETGVRSGTRSLADQDAAYAKLTGSVKTLAQVEQQLKELEDFRANASMSVKQQLQGEIGVLEQQRAALLASGDAARTAASEERSLGNEVRRRGDFESQTFRGQARNVLTGRAGVGSLLSPSNIAGFTAAGFAIGAVFTGLQHLEDALRVTGDESFTFEGRVRNAGAELLTGDLIGGLDALIQKAPTAQEKLKSLLTTVGTTSVDLRNFAFAQTEAAKATDEQAAAADRQATGGLRGGAAFRDTAKELRNTADSERDAAAAARDLAAAFQTSITAAQDVEAAIVAAGSEAARFGEANRGPGAQRRGSVGAGAEAVDSTDTIANQRAIEDARVQRNKTLNDDLALARKREREAEQTAARFAAVDDIEGAKERQRIIEEAKTKVALIEQQIQQQNEQAAKAAEAERKRLAAEAKRAAEERAREAKALRDARHDALLNDINYEIELAQLAVRRAQVATKTTKDDIAAEHRLIDLLKSASQTAGLSKEERRRFLLDLGGARIDLQDLLNGKGGDGFSIQDLFQAAGDQFSTFGSNISGRNGVLSRQDARASLGQDILARINGDQLTVQERMAATLESIDAKLSGGSNVAPTRNRIGSTIAVGAAEVAAAFHYGVN